MNDARIDRRDIASAPPTEPSRHPLLARHHAHDGILFPGRHSTIHLQEPRLIGTYSDIGVVIPGFGPGVEWFTTIWGDQDDNILALQLDESLTGPLPRVPHSGIVPLGEHVDGLNEFKIEGTIADRLELVLIDGDNDWRIGNPVGVRRQVSFHDNCMWAVEPIDDEVIRAIVRQQLAFHEEYLDCIGGLMPYVEPVIELLREGYQLKLKSLPSDRFRVSYGPKRMFGRRTVTWRPVEPASI